MMSGEPPPKKHKKHKKDKDRDRDRDRYDEGDPGTPISTNRLKLILRVGGSSTPEHSDSPAPSMPHILNVPYDDDSRHSGSLSFSHKKSKKEKKEKKRKKEKKHKHKEKRRREKEEALAALLMKTESSSSNIQELRSEPPIIPLDVTLPEEMTPSPNLATLSAIKVEEASAVPDLIVGENVEPIPAAAVPPVALPSIHLLNLPKRPLDNKALKKLLEYLVRALEKKDAQQFFAWPVTDRIAPGYSSIISTPMDFSTMKSKVDHEEYSSLHEFIADFKLMCENAMIYNQMDTIYYRAAKKLLLGGIKMLEPEKIRALLPLIPSIRLLQEEQLGFQLVLEPVQSDGGDLMSMSEEDSQENVCYDPTQSEHYVPPHPNDPPDVCGAFTEDLTTQEVLQQARLAAREAAHRLATKKPNRKMGFIRQKPDGSTSLSILVPSNGFKPGQEVPMSLGAFAGKIQQGSTQLLVVKEDRKNFQRAAKPLHYGSFSSFAPTRDSSFSALNEEESNLLSSAYGESREYAESLVEFTRGCDYSLRMVDSILDTITNGEHSKAINVIEERQRMETERAEALRKEEEFARLEAEEAMYLEKMGFPTCPKDESPDIVKTTEDINFESLSSLNDIGIETGFLNELKENLNSVSNSNLDNKLKNTAELLGTLQKVQNVRYTQPLLAGPPYVWPPTDAEVNIANRVTENLVALTKEVSPAEVVSSDSLHKALGIDLDAFGYGLESTSTENEVKQSAPVPMDTEVHEEAEASGPVESSEVVENLPGSGPSGEIMEVETSHPSAPEDQSQTGESEPLTTSDVASV